RVQDTEVPLPEAAGLAALHLIAALTAGHVHRDLAPAAVDRLDAGPDLVVAAAAVAAALARLGGRVGAVGAREAGGHEVHGHLGGVAAVEVEAHAHDLAQVVAAGIAAQHT